MGWLSIIQLAVEVLKLFKKSSASSAIEELKNAKTPEAKKAAVVSLSSHLYS